MSASKYNPATVQIIIDALKEGVFITCACGLARISRETHYAWMKKYPDYSDTVRHALATAQMFYVQQLKEKRDPKFMLARRFGYVEKVEVDTIKKVTYELVIGDGVPGNQTAGQAEAADAGPDEDTGEPREA